MALEHAAVPITSSTQRPVAESGAYSHESFASEPIQLPIVPLNVFWLHKLHTTGGASARGADRSAKGLWRGGGAERRTEPRGP